MNFTVTGQRLVSDNCDLYVSRSVDIYEAVFAFDESWDGFSKTAVFQTNSETAIEVVLVDDACTIPHEVLAVSGQMRIGVYGVKDEMVMPTVWGQTVRVHLGTPTGSTGTTPTPSIYAQILAEAEAAHDIAEAVQDSWESVTASAETLEPNESASVEFENNNFHFGIPKGSKGDTGESGFSPTITVIDISGGHRVTITDSQGMESFDVLDGHDGQNGADGYSPTVAISDITDGHRVVITDKNGSHTFDVMDGEQGAQGVGIASIAKTSSVGLVDTYTITLTNGNTSTFTVTNGADGTSDFAEYLPIDSASGSIASFVDGAKNIPVESLKVNIVAVQSGSGDPSPNNIRPISGHTQADVVGCGGNLLNYESLTWTSGIRDDNGNQTSSSASHYCSAIAVKPNTTYTFSGAVASGTSWRIYSLDYDGDWISRTASIPEVPSVYSSYTFTTGANCYYIQIQTSASVTLEGAMFNLGSTAQPYVAYNGTTYTIPFGTTVYGGSLEVESGVLTVTHAIVDLGDFDYRYQSSGNGFFLASSGLPNFKTVSAYYAPLGIICDRYKTGTSNSAPQSDCEITATINSAILRIRDDSFNGDANAFKAGVTGSKVVYELATPTTIQLTPVEVSTILGNNSIYSNCNGTVEVVYRADIQKYVDKKISALASLI